LSKCLSSIWHCPERGSFEGIEGIEDIDGHERSWAEDVQVIMHTIPMAIAVERILFTCHSCIPLP
jgi:hypothetical protein